MYASIPVEMRAFAQWVVWRFEESDGAKPTKVPYDVKTGRMASVTNPATWADYNTCLLAAQADRGYDGIGFVLTRDDPYTIIDLDDTGADPDALREQIRIFEAFDSYSERSVSKTGLHIIVRGSLPSGRRRNKVELYHSERFMIMTGDVFEAKPIAERQELLNQMWHEMGGQGAAAMYDGDSPQVHDDAVIIEKALAAKNGPKFRLLHEGRWQELYGSQSEADFAYVDILAFYTQNREQLARLFRNSPLGAREKAQRNDYVNYMVNKSFDRLLPPVQFDSIYNAIEAEIQAQKEAHSPQAQAAVAIMGTPAALELPPPPGLMGDIAQFVYSAAPRPVPEIALTAAIGLMAGIAGRAYNISGTGLNQYVMLLAPTGTGKEAISRGVSRIAAAMAPFEPFKEFVGPGEIASGQALIKALARVKIPSFVSILGEIGLRLKSMSSDYISPADNMLKRAWLDLYNKSGKNDLLQPSVYSDKDKGTEQVLAPAYSMIGESTPESFYANLSEEMIASGLLPRFTIIEYYGKRPRRNVNAAYAQPSPELIAKITELSKYATDMNATNNVIEVEQDDLAKQYTDAFDDYCDEMVNADDRTVVRQLWSRGHMKLLKLAGLIAVGVSPARPVITLVEAEWARTQVERDIRNLLARFEAGTIGYAAPDTAEDKQTTAVIAKVRKYITSEYADVHKYAVSVEMHRDKVIPYAYLSRTLLTLTCFAKDKAGATRSLKRAVETLVDNGDLQEVGKGEMIAKYQFNGKAYVLSNVKHLRKEER